jgi:hypothetical protein
MTVKHPKTQEWDDRLFDVFEKVDVYLEDNYGDRFERHPNRPARGEAAYGSLDGLFNIGVSFSPGYGSKFGRGYVIDMVISTLEKVSSEEREGILNDAIKKTREEIEKAFPERDLKVSRDGNVFKIHGDTGLGDI